MAFLGMGIGGMVVAFLSSAVVLVLLYMARQKRRRVKVPFVALFEAGLGTRARAPFLHRLRHLGSLLIFLCIAALLVLALGDPRWGSAQHDRSKVFIVDTSWSMAAEDEGQGTRLAAAQAALRDQIAALGPGDRALVIAAGPGPEPVAPWTSDPTVLNAAADNLRVSASNGSVPEAIALGLDYLRGAEHPELFVLSDHRPEDVTDLEMPPSGQSPVRFVYLPQVEDLEATHNPAIASLAARRYPLDRQSVEALVTVVNPDAESRSVELAVLGDGAPLFKERMTLSPGESQTKVLEDLPAQVAHLHATVTPVDGLPDAQPEDSRAFAAIPSRKRLRVGVVSEDNLYLSAALLLDGYLDVVEVSREAVATAAAVDVWIFDGVRPVARPSAPAIYLDPRGEGYTPIETNGSPLTAPFFDKVDRDHPLARFVALRDVNIAQALRWTLEATDQAIGVSAEGPLLVTGRRDTHAFVALAFNPRESDLPLRAAFPLLLMNAVHFLVQAPVDEGLGATVGRPYALEVPTHAARVVATRVAPTTSRVSPVAFVVRAEAGRAEASVTLNQPGIYRLVAQDGSGNALLSRDLTVTHAASADELALHRASASSKPARTQDAALWRERGSRAGALRTLLWPGLIAAAFALLAFEWLAFHRRWTE